MAPSSSLFLRDDALNGSRQKQASPPNSRPRKHKCQHAKVPPEKYWDSLPRTALTQLALRALRRYRPRPQPSKPPAEGCNLIPATLAAKLRDRKCAPGSPDYCRGLRAMAAGGGPDIRHLRSFPDPRKEMDGENGVVESACPGSNSSYTGTCSASTGGMTYNSHFEQNLVKHGVYPDCYVYPNGEEPPAAENLQEIIQALKKPIPCLSTSMELHKEFKRFKMANAHAADKVALSHALLRVLEGDDVDYETDGTQAGFTNLVPLSAGLAASISPDFCDGAPQEQLRARLRQQFGGHVMPAVEEGVPIVPNFFLEVKGPDGTDAVAQRQICYDMAFGARAIHTLRTVVPPLVIFDNRAHTLGCTYVAGVLKIFASHPVAPADAQSNPGYVTTLVDGFFMLGNSARFYQGITAYRNARKWAERERNEAITQANEHEFVQEYALS
ncbi:hypothetical protein CDD81_5621 [Ophiocordyceps australis]|uniref:Uncharacterized protein n=1 Tax=Ophiocordyceps australis TaxID=1399860 RepID=A0A2C5Y873_9HYPO|nr:hypothetical protein CDD81_5621 [Ophiocordyceps australis]